MNDEVILKGIAKQNQFIIEKFIKQNFEHLLKFVKWQKGTLEDAEDLMQDAIVALYNICKNDEVNIEKGIVGFFVKIYRGLWYNSQKYNIQSADKQEIDDNIRNKQNRVDDNILKELERNERYKLYRKHLSLLNESCIDILEMFNKGVPVSEILNKYNYSLSYYYKKISLCRKNLIENIAKDSVYKELTVENKYQY